jgi:hypothetical protein
MLSIKIPAPLDVVDLNIIAKITAVENVVKDIEILIAQEQQPVATAIFDLPIVEQERRDFERPISHPKHSLLNTYYMTLMDLFFKLAYNVNLQGKVNRANLYFAQSHLYGSKSICIAEAEFISVAQALHDQGQSLILIGEPLLAVQVLETALTYMKDKPTAFKESDRVADAVFKASILQDMSKAYKDLDMLIDSKICHIAALESETETLGNNLELIRIRSSFKKSSTRLCNKKS